MASIDFNIFNKNLGEFVYLADLVDVIIFAVIIYFVIVFLKQARSLTALIGIGLIGIIYALARAFHLHVTTLILQSFFSIFIIILVIVFQDELKRSFELIAASSTRKIKSKPIVSFSETISSIVQATSNLMRKNHGALIVITGKEAIGRHLKGGLVLDGLITTPLLESVFDPSSPGHDGAVIVTKNRISKFGAHLPLSENVKQIKERGTRHSAAIGMSEKTDVLVIIVSEERGEISIALNGKMKTIKDTQELERHLNQYYSEVFPKKSENFLTNFFKQGLAEKISAILVASVVWFFVVFQAEVVQRDFEIPISYLNIPEEKIIENTEPKNVTVTLSARGQTILALLDLESIRLVIPENEISPGLNKIELDRSYINHPFNVSVVNISPSFVYVEVEKYKTYQIPIKVNFLETPENNRLKEIVLNPSEIKILIPENDDAPDFILTEGIDAKDINETKTLEVRVNLPDSYRLHKDSSRIISVTLVIGENE